MKRLMLRIAGLMVVFGALSVATAQAGQVSIHVGIGVPVAPVVVAPRVIVAPPVAVVGALYPYAAYYGPAPYPGYIWRGGYYAGYRWVPGGWIAPAARVYAAPRYGYGGARVYHAHR